MNSSRSLIATWPSVLFRIRYGFFALLLWISPAHGFGELGHQIVADLATAQLTPAARQTVTQLLALEGFQQLRQISSWADSVRDDARFARTGPLHYINFPRSSCRYVARRDCREGACVVGAIQAFARLLADPKATPQARLTALKWLTHLVADVHQPLHAGYADDRGGNQFQIRYQSSGSNLHWLWDTGLLQAAQESRETYVQRLSQQPITPPRYQAKDPETWAESSCQLLTMHKVYPNKRFIDRQYVDQMRPVVDQQLHLAGARLAGLLNTLLK